MIHLQCQQPPLHSALPLWVSSSKCMQGIELAGRLEQTGSKMAEEHTAEVSA